MSGDDSKKVAIDETVVVRSESDQDTVIPEKKGSVLNVLVQGVALFSDGYSVQVIGYMQTVMAKLFVSLPHTTTKITNRFQLSQRAHCKHQDSTLELHPHR